MRHQLNRDLSVILVLPLLIIFMNGCSPVIEKPLVNNLLFTAYPPSGSSIEYPYPEPVADDRTLLGSVFPENIHVLEPKANSGNVIGTLLTFDDSQPYFGYLLLGEMVYSDSPDAPPLISYSYETSISADMDITGKFVFTDVPPGKYGIVIWSPTSGTLLVDMNSGEMIEVNVIAGENTDLGSIYIK